VNLAAGFSSNGKDWIREGRTVNQASSKPLTPPFEVKGDEVKGDEG